MVQQLTQGRNGTIVGPDNKPFNLASVCLALTKTYVRRESQGVIDDARMLAEANGLEYFLVLKDEKAGLMRVDFGYPGNFEDQRVLGTKSVRLYTVNFYGVPGFNKAQKS
ncbi:hypothetical protein FJZ19_01440 [Candidatus Pacearchaeota archaeon]|nr:hypothetical protein [Candidatus Pacearchaeota archaeon]